VTTDSPRHEDPRLIAKSVAGGCRKGGRAYVKLEPDRRRAIGEALGMARAGDVVVVAGFGHERVQVIGGRTLPFSDVDAVREQVGK